MKKFNLFIINLMIAAFLVSCNLGGERYEKYTGYVSVVETIIPDSAVAGQTIPLYARATAPNGCWSDIKIHLGKATFADTVYGISSTGLYESYDNLCFEILVSADTTFHFKPDSSGTYLFISYSSLLEPRYDTLYVVDPMPAGR